MRLKIPFSSDLKVGSTRMVNRFAWLPTVVGGRIIWLETYQILKARIGHTHTVVLEGKPVNFMVAKWVELSKRVIDA